MDIQQVAITVFVSVHIETSHQNWRCRDSGSPFDSTYLLELFNAALLARCHCCCFERLTASAIPASADRDTLIPSTFASWSRELSRDRFVGLLLCFVASVMDIAEPLMWMGNSKHMPIIPVHQICTYACFVRRERRFLEGVIQSVSGDAASAALLGAQNGQCSQQAAQKSTTQGQVHYSAPHG